MKNKYGIGFFAAAIILMLVLTGAITKEDMKIVPGGARITALLRRMKIWR